MNEFVMWKSPSEVKEYFNNYIKQNNIKGKDFYPLLRYALSGKLDGPDLWEAIFLLGPEETYNRMIEFYKCIKQN